MKLKNKLLKICKWIKYGVRMDSDTYVAYLRKKGMRIGERTVIFDPRNTVIDETRPWMIEIGSDVQITSGVTILTHGYDWAVLKGKYGAILGSSGKIEIGNNVFVGVNTIILKGVHIGNNVIIGAGSLVNKNIPDNSVVAGNPVRKIYALDEYLEERKEKQLEEAMELVKEYRIVYKKNPSEMQLDEFFWLFCGENDEYNCLHSSWKKKMCLVVNIKCSIEALKKNKKIYNDLNDFLKHIN